MLKISSRLWRALRSAVLVVMVIGISIPAVKVPLDAFGATSEVFERQVGWANILALTLAAVGLLLLIAEKKGNFITVDYDLNSIVDKLSVKLRRSGAHTLAQLLSTDGLDSRSASFRLLLKEGEKSSQECRSIEREDLARFYAKSANGRMVVLGAPGSGKSVLALQLADQLLGEAGKTNKMPIVLSLSSWDSLNSSLEEWLIQEVAVEFSLKDSVAKRLVQEGRVTPILDGLDEMGDDGDAGRSLRAIGRINDYIAVTPDCNIVVTSRDSRAYGRMVKRLRSVKIVRIVPFDSSQIEKHIYLHCAESDRFAEWAPLIRQLRSRKGQAVREVLCTPWRLNSAIVFFLAGGNPDLLLPGADERSSSTAGYQRRIRDILTASFIYARVAAHSSNAASISRNISSMLALAGRLKENHDQGGPSSDIVLFRWWRNVGEDSVRKVHVFFTFWLLHLPALSLNFLDGVKEGGLDGVWLFLALSANYFTIMLYSSIKAAKDRGPSRLSMQNLRNFRVMVAAFFFALLLSGSAVAMAFAYGSAYAVAFGVISVFMLVLTVGTSSSNFGEVFSPLEAIRNDRNIAAVSGLLLGAYGIIYYLPIYGLGVAAWFGGMCVLGRICCSAYVRYLAAVGYGKFRFGLPLMLARFLGWGRQAGVLRISGSGYQFRHRDVLEYLESVSSGSTRRPDVF